MRTALTEGSSFFLFSRMARLAEKRFEYLEKQKGVPIFAQGFSH